MKKAEKGFDPDPEGIMPRYLMQIVLPEGKLVCGEGVFPSRPALSPAAGGKAVFFLTCPRLQGRKCMSDNTILIHVNGRDEQVACGTTLLQLVQNMKVDPARVVVEHNLEIVGQEKLAGTALADNDTVEVIHFVGGG